MSKTDFINRTANIIIDRLIEEYAGANDPNKAKDFASAQAIASRQKRRERAVLSGQQRTTSPKAARRYQAKHGGEETDWGPDLGSSQATKPVGAGGGVGGTILKGPTGNTTSIRTSGGGLPVPVTQDKPVRKGASRVVASHQNFIGKTVEILMERNRANKAKKNAWMANQPTNPDNEPKIPKKHKAEAAEDTADSVQFNAVRRSQHNVPEDSKVTQGAGDEGKPFDAKSKLTAARTVQKNTTSPFMSAVDARKARVNTAYQMKRDRDVASHQNFIGKAVEILAERMMRSAEDAKMDAMGKSMRKAVLGK